MPRAPALRPPKNMPKKPSLWMLSFTPSYKICPNPISGTEAPAPANFRRGSYKSKKLSMEPVHTRHTIILPGINFVLSMRICTMAHIIPPTKNALK